MATSAADHLAATRRRDEDEKQHDTHHSYAAAGHVAAVVAARLQLVKVPGVHGPIAQLASRPTVAGGAVAVTFATRVNPTLAWAPLSI
eukprot:486692-Prymnesium_polylepis.2